LNSLRFHDLRHRVLTAVEATRLQFNGHTWASVAVVKFVVNLTDRGNQFPLTNFGDTGLSLSPGMVATGRNFEGVAHPRDGPLVGVIADELEGQFGGLAK
jgi:hypothetical protein